jgi:hypothetical protein
MLSRSVTNVIGKPWVAEEYTVAVISALPPTGMASGAALTAKD